MNFRKVFIFAILLPLPLLLIVGNKRKTWQALGSFVFLSLEFLGYHGRLLKES